MTEIKLIKKNTDLSILQPLNWDVVMNGKPFQVYRAPGFVHSIGGHWGENDYWACPYGEDPTYENLVEFSGYAVAWGIRLEEVNTYRSKWSEVEIRQSFHAMITRNGEDFYGVPASDISYAYAEAYRLIRTKIQEGVIDFNVREFWKKDIEGRHILYRGKKYTLFHYIKGQCCAMAAHGWRTVEEIENDPHYGTMELKLDLLHDGNIDWFPESKDNETN